ncbi:basic proline-rich protein-like [Sciurus carolinensis]|uniref:basic proline-rich protein-like n=1 Tax=Sciurus carolinensis TaxID=30640 RepID=UPI001FB2FB2C|nr:basic proline-rich protein-like [Sciurus carolinensis]
MPAALRKLRAACKIRGFKEPAAWGPEASGEPQRPVAPGSHQRFETQRSGTPTPPARSPLPRRLTRAPLRLQGIGPGPAGVPPGLCPAGDPGAPRPPETSPAGARHLSRPAPAGPTLTSSRGPTARLRAPGLGSCRRLRRGPAAAAAHFRFPARPEPLPRLGNHLKPPPHPARPRPAPRRPAPRAARPGSAHARAPRSRRPTPASARGKGNRHRLAVSARAHAWAGGGRRLRGGRRRASSGTAQISTCPLRCQLFSPSITFSRTMANLLPWPPHPTSQPRYLSFAPI